MTRPCLLLQCITDSLRGLESLFSIGIGKNDCELLTAVATCDVRGSSRSKELSESFEDEISEWMTMTIVQILETIEITHDQ